MKSFLISASERPNIRFQGFSEAWTPKPFGSVLQLISRSVKMNDMEEYSLVTVKRRYAGVVQRGTYKGKSILVKSQFRLESGDFVISKRQICHNACGIVPVSLKGSIVSNEYAVFEAKENLFLPFFNYLCRLPKVSHTFYLSSIGVHIEKMLFKVDDWLRWKLPFPSLPEQHKIAAFLSVVDQKIQLLQRKKELLERYKKGVMQKLFSQEIRFKDEDGNDYPDWEEKRLDEICVKIQDGTHFSPKLFDKEQYMYITSKNVKNGYLDFSNVSYVDEKAHKAIYKRCDVQWGDVLLTKDGTIGQACINTLKEEFSILSSVAFIRTNKDHSNSFLCHYIISPYGQKTIQRVIAGQALKRITLTKIRNFTFSFPSLQEQNKVAGVLSTIDEGIGLLKRQQAEMKRFKIGLLQQMFV